jgi:HSP20 family protein
MSLIHWQPLKELNTLQHRMNRLFDEFMHGSETSLQHMPSTWDTVWTPAIELKETDTEIVLKAQVPGVDAKDLDVQVSENAVSIAGVHQEEQRTEEEGMVRSEFYYGQFQRVVPLPTSVQYEKVKAEFKDGIITLTLPKEESARGRVVKVNLDEQQRQTVTEQRQHDKHLQQTMHRRAEDALETTHDADLDQVTRESTTKERQHADHVQDTTQMRSMADSEPIS